MRKTSSKDGRLQYIHDLTIHARLNLSFVMFRVECLSLSTYKNERKCSGVCFKYILIYGAYVFLSHSGIPANA